MYEYIKGEFKGMHKDYIVIENNGIGYKIFTSGSTLSNMPKIDETALIFIEQVVRQDFIGLYGFITKEELEMFKLLLTINGVGSKAALSLLSISTVKRLKYAVFTEDEKTLIRAPGIGKKTAQRIILELKDKIKVEDVEIEDLKGDNAEDKAFKNIQEEVVEALLSLGYTKREVESALKSLKPSDSVETMIKDCLKYLMN
ncbi:Holliday junction branch migration protein RuvA [Clostridium algidicarnis]|uniref:Holliday junction branch migration complex subunit RuvA n=1 Tax=Clostridium algidicarnis DSM 15099 TaxID=1121295 RepID=A0A2S6G107_9CLOT|nr:Holliday junction branch migration protein RuvA [Clostridium algidicarnis]MBB6630529.1 Holliday junction branch migration protein RuvA [Clostridium algidicarnis]MBB6696334.1 Holliday junction branch migration protein RuvA [Clostridium algidicarnis]MBU3205660.1 Holliday junction branch migration protein RuvA [Clostridium algidicarnis]PPK49578.1 Holliday junction DNA helicase subunit RuvA [Clostridium algidicarnis DSM 15099]